MAVWDSAERGARLRRGGHPWLAVVLSPLDMRLRRQQAVFEYTRNPACIFRLDVGPSSRSLVLSDGTELRAGDRVARLHYWNEQVPLVPEGGATIAWGRQMHRGIAASLRELAAFLAGRGDLDDVAVVCGDVPSGTDAQRDQVARIMGRYGFESIAEPEHLPFGERLHRFGENILISMIVLAHNARAFHANTLMRVRVPIYMSRRVLESNFSSG